MGQVTATAQVWTPDASDLNEPDVYLAIMAASIEDGLGARMAKQELNKGLLAGLTTPFMLPASGTAATVPYTVGAAPLYNNGVTLTGGVATIVTPGLYQLNANFFGYQTGGYASGNMYVNTTSISELITGLTSNGGSTYFFSGVLSGVQVLAAGDTVSVKVTSYNKSSDSPNAPQLYGASGRMLNTLAVTLLKAT